MSSATGGSPSNAYFELYQLRCFVAAAEELHFGKAAARMGMTQPPFSRQIQTLEQILGVKLLDRTTNRAAALTPAGRVFLLEARSMLRLADRATAATRSLARGQWGAINLGFLTTVGYSLLPKLLLQCAMLAPHIKLNLVETVSNVQFDKLIDGSIDVGLLRRPIDLSMFSTMKLSDERFVAALPAGDARLKRKALSLAEFHGKPLVMYSAEGGRHLHDVISNMFAESGHVPNIVHSVTQTHTMLALVRAGIGAALVPEAAMSLLCDGIFYRPLLTTSTAPSAIYAAWRTTNDNPVLSAFLDILRSQIARAPSRQCH